MDRILEKTVSAIEDELLITKANELFRLQLRVEALEQALTASDKLVNFYREKFAAEQLKDEIMRAANLYNSQIAIGSI